MITNELKQFIEAHPHILKVYFTQDGEWFIKAPEFKGERYARFRLEPVKGKDGKNSLVSAPVIESKIVKTFTRAEILAEEKANKKSATA